MATRTVSLQSIYNYREYQVIRKDIILAVRELTDRHFTVSDIAAKLNISVELAQMALDFINNILT